MQISDQREEAVAKVKEHADIVQVIGEHVELKRSGARYLGLCPFHGEKTPSFSVHPGHQFFHCFGCGESGDVFSFVMKYQNLNFVEALKLLAEKYRIDLPENRQTTEQQEKSRKRKLLFEVNEKAAARYFDFLKNNEKGAEAARKYLQNRGIEDRIVEKFRIGYAPPVEAAGWNFLGSTFSQEQTRAAVETGLLVDNKKGGTYDRFRDRIVFPIFNIAGQVCGFGGRIVGEGQPKYLNSPESAVFNKSNLLLGLFQQKESIRRHNRAILVEGNFDLVSLVAKGCENVVAPLGTAVTREQLRLIKRFAEEATLLFDGDEAGGKAAARAVPLFLAEQLAGKVALLPGGHDPDTYIREFGLAELSRILGEAKDLPEFVLGRLVEQFGLGLDGKRRIVEELVPLVEAAPSPLQRSVFLSHFAQELGMAVEQLEQFMAAPRDVFAQQPPERPRAELRAEPLTIAQKQLAEFMVLYPDHFELLAGEGLRDCLAGSFGEILFLEMEKLLRVNKEAEPEELLTVLPEGVERRFVAELLLQPPQGTTDSDGAKEDLAELVRYLQRSRLQKSSACLLKQIEEAQHKGDMELLRQLLEQKMDLTRKLHEADS
ncbi:DNA primase [Desulforhopalus singaporensis]|uniref:DNA primase n=1 Tax=Desulforhopalus singaporensis TaxID=91360 RepID=A0A1H0JUA4_9BACT|nr:DNA primase [Desulforhopalus singaporensis]SDO47099.1 DNA primase [Desulforhopalus singaporensis]